MNKKAPHNRGVAVLRGCDSSVLDNCFSFGNDFGNCKPHQS